MRNIMENKHPSSIQTKEIRVRSAPLPTPEEFAGYEKTCPGAADRILKIAETQSQHRQQLEKKSVEAIIWDGHFGLIFAFFLSLIALCGGIFLVWKDHEILGTIFAGIGLTSVIKAFVQTNSHVK